MVILLEKYLRIEDLLIFFKVRLITFIVMSIPPPFLTGVNSTQKLLGAPELRLSGCL